MIRNTTLPKRYAGIELGNGSFVEITDSAINIRGIGGYGRLNGSTSRRVGQMIEIAKGLHELKATPTDVDRVALDYESAGIDDNLIEVLVGKSAELIPYDRESAYYMLRLTFALVRQYGTMWKHALVASLLGFFTLYDRQSPAEAITVFDDLKIVSQILSSYLCCSDNVRGLYQLACRGLEEAHSAQRSVDRSDPAEPELSAQVWSAVRDYSRATDEHELYLQSEAWARGLLLLEGQPEQTAASQLCRIGKDYLSRMQQGGSIRNADCLPVLTLAEVLAKCGAHCQALELLEAIRPACRNISPLMQRILVNRMAAIQIEMGKIDNATQLLDSLPSNGHSRMSGYSITEQAELLLATVNRAEMTAVKEREHATWPWAKELERHFQSLEQWNQIVSHTREDDLRLLYCAMLRDTVRERLAGIGKKS